MINILLYQVLAYIIHGKKIKKSYKYNKLKISIPTWNEKFKLFDGSYSVSRLFKIFWIYFKKHGRKADNPSIRIYVIKIQK